MKHKDQVIFALRTTMLLSMLAGCGDADEALGGGYFRATGDPSHSVIWKKSGNGNRVVVDEQVVDVVKVNNQYLLVLRKIAISPDCYDKNNVATIITHYTNESQFWIIDLSAGTDTGPLTEDSFNEKLDRLGIARQQLRTPVKYHSNDEAFETIRRKCDHLR